MNPRCRTEAQAIMVGKMAKLRIPATHLLFSFFNESGRNSRGPRRALCVSVSSWLESPLGMNTKDPLECTTMKGVRLISSVKTVEDIAEAMKNVNFVKEGPIPFV